MPSDSIKKVLMLKNIKIVNKSSMWIECVECGKKAIRKIGCRSCVILEKTSFINDNFKKGWDIKIDERGRKPICSNCK